MIPLHQRPIQPPTPFARESPLFANRVNGTDQLSRLSSRALTVLACQLPPGKLFSFGLLGIAVTDLNVGLLIHFRLSLPASLITLTKPAANRVVAPKGCPECSLASVNVWSGTFHAWNLIAADRITEGIARSQREGKNGGTAVLFGIVVFGAPAQLRALCVPFPQFLAASGASFRTAGEVIPNTAGTVIVRLCPVKGHSLQKKLTGWGACRCLGWRGRMSRGTIRSSHSRIQFNTNQSANRHENRNRDFSGSRFVFFVFAITGTNDRYN